MQHHKISNWINGLRYQKATVPLFLSKLYPFQTSNVPSQWQIEIEGFYYRVLLGLSRRPLQESLFFSTRHFDYVITSHLTSHLTERHRCTRTVPWMLSSKSQRRRGAWADSQLSASRKSEKEIEMFICLSLSYQFLIVETQIPRDCFQFSFQISWIWTH